MQWPDPDLPYRQVPLTQLHVFSQSSPNKPGAHSLQALPEKFKLLQEHVP